jgi:F0F1-type ATP synthase assembly protein I
MKFSSGQIGFIIFFIVTFVVGLIWAYSKDKIINSKYYPGAWKMIIYVIAGFIGLFLMIKAAKSF